MVDVPQENVEYYCFVNKNGGEGQPYKWDIAQFTLTNRLIPLSVTATERGMDSARVRMLRESRDSGTGAFVAEWGPTAIGRDIIISSENPFTDSSIIFMGYIAEIARENLPDLDSIGMLNCRGLGHQMDEGLLSGFHAVDSASGASYVIDTPPTFNLQDAGGAVIGNKLTDSNGIKCFATIPSLCSSTVFFSRLEILNHVLRYCKNTGLPTITLSIPSNISTYLSDTAKPEVFDLSNVTLAGAIDLLIPPTQGLGWVIEPNGGGIYLRIFSKMDDKIAGYSSDFPVQAAEDISIDDAESGLRCVSFVASEQAGDLYDSVEVIGNNCMVGVTVSKLDGNLDQGWTAGQQTKYRVGSSDIGSGYSDKTTQGKIELNEQTREQAELSNVFRLFNVTQTAAQPTRSATPGTGPGALKLVPEINYSGGYGAASVNNSVGRCPYLPLTRFARELPWFVGVPSSGVDSRTDEEKARGELMKPRVFIYDPSAPTTAYVNLPECQDILVPMKKRGMPTVTPDDKTLGMRVEFSPPELLAKADWDDGTDGIGRVFPLSGDPFGKVINWRKMCLTAAIPSDQKVSFKVMRNGVADGEERRKLIINDDTLHCQVMLAGSIIGCKKDGTPDRVAADVFIRDDFKVAEKQARLNAAFLFRPRTAVTFSLACPSEKPAWAKIGKMLGGITQVAESEDSSISANVADAYTTINAIEYDLSYDAPRLTVSTAVAAVSFGPSKGGPVSNSLGGTIAQAVAGNQRDSVDNKSLTKKVPVHVGGGTAEIVEFNVVEVTGGNTLDTGEVGINTYAGTLPSVPSAYDPNVTSTFINGIGRGRLYVNGNLIAGYVLIVNDNRGSFYNALLQGDVKYAGGPVTIPVTGGGSVQAYTAA